MKREKMLDEWNEEPIDFQRPAKKKNNKKFKSDEPETLKEEEKPLNIHQIKKMQKEEREKKEKETIEKERIEKEELEGKDEDEEKEENIENESTCPTIHIIQNNNNFLNERLFINDITESNNKQNTDSGNNGSIINYEESNKKINEPISMEEPKKEENYFYINNFEKLSPEELKMKIDGYFNNWQFYKIIKEIQFNEIYFKNTFEFFLELGILNCISHPFLNEILKAIIGKSLCQMDFERIDFIFELLKNDNIVKHSKDIYSCYIINALIDAFHIIKFFYMKNFQINEEIKNTIKNLEEKIDYIYSELKKNDLVQIFTHYPATFVIQNLMDKINTERQKEIFECALKNINVLIDKQEGHFVLRKIIEIIPENSKICAELIEQIIEYKYFQELLMDKIANHLIKIILIKTKNKYFNLIFSKIKCSICKLAMNQYASFVIEELISVANKKQIKKIIKEINNSKEILLKDNYGNYVIQTLKRKISLL